ncbi:MAG: flotillin-like protein FloA [Defluviitaleaceae bacterium]|nr:flotillin-like protein FloA [Defluviitaleaceae bacterium]
MEFGDIPIIPIIIATAVLLFIVLFLRFVPLTLWISAISSGAKVSIGALIGMRLRKVSPVHIVRPLIKCTKANIPIPVGQLEAHYLAGGRVDAVINALIAAHRANIELPFDKATAIDLAGRDVFEAVRMSVNPKVIETPMISAMAVNGIEVKAVARITVRTNIQRLVGGAGEATIVARVGEGIVTTIGSAQSHRDVLENPDRISKTVLGKGLDAGTAYEILSIDIADVDVGRNIGAQLQIEQAEADKKIAEAKAEERRALAVAQEQEMRAEVERMRAKVVEAEAEVPLAYAEALRTGRISAEEYLGLQNKKADTKMRENIGSANMEMSINQPK